MVPEKIPLSNLLFLDIETVPEQPDYLHLDEEWQALWEHKTAYQRRDEVTPEAFYERAGIWAEFGKIVCISVGYFAQVKGDRQFRVRSFYGEERTLLREFSDLLEAHFSGPQHLLCGHNAKEFDFPYIARRMLIHSLPLPSKLQLFGKKPWEIPHLDTLELWKFGDYKHFTSLKLLCKVLGIPTSKDDIDGSQVAHVYYHEGAIDRIITYCEKDVVAVAQIWLRLRREPLLELDEIKTV